MRILLKEGRMKVLNLYSCIGGNRAKWDEVDPTIEVTAVELDEELARLYKERFPNDTVIVDDAHQYLLDHYSEFDFIWSSPPCPSHSRANYWASKTVDTRAKVYPDLTLYQEILFLQHYYTGGYCVENVIPYYEPLIPAKKRGRHLYWTNFNLPSDLGDREFKITQTKNEVKELQKFHEINVESYKGDQRLDKICRNLVDYEAGRTILETYLGVKRQKDVKQKTLFND